MITETVSQHAVYKSILAILLVSTLSNHLWHLIGKGIQELGLTIFWYSLDSHIIRTHIETNSLENWKSSHKLYIIELLERDYIKQNIPSVRKYVHEKLEMHFASLTLSMNYQ